MANIYNANTALKKGTIFKALDQPYKNYIIDSIDIMDEKEALMLEVQKYSLCLHDIDLYLDLFPNDSNAMKLREKYLKEKKIACDIYDKRFQSISKESKEMNNIPYSWSTKGFPWGDD